MNNYDELLNRLRDTTHIPYHIHTMEAADTIESLQAKVTRQLEIYHSQRGTIGELCDENEALQAQVKELEALLAGQGKWVWAEVAQSVVDAPENPASIILAKVWLPDCATCTVCAGSAMARSWLPDEA